MGGVAKFVKKVADTGGSIVSEVSDALNGGSDSKPKSQSAPKSTPAASEGNGEASAKTKGGSAEGGEGAERRRRRQLRAMNQPNESLFNVLGSSQGGRSRLG